MQGSGIQGALMVGGERGGVERERENARGSLFLGLSEESELHFFFLFPPPSTRRAKKERRIKTQRKQNSALSFSSLLQPFGPFRGACRATPAAASSFGDGPSPPRRRRSRRSMRTRQYDRRPVVSRGGRARALVVVPPHVLRRRRGPPAPPQTLGTPDRRLRRDE